jgi:hypothetical protein
MAADIAKFICIAISETMTIPRVVGEADTEDVILHKMVDAQSRSPHLEYAVYERKKFKKRYDK